MPAPPALMAAPAATQRGGASPRSAGSSPSNSPRKASSGSWGPPPPTAPPPHLAGSSGSGRHLQQLQSPGGGDGGSPRPHASSPSAGYNSSDEDNDDDDARMRSPTKHIGSTAGGGARAGGSTGIVLQSPISSVAKSAGSTTKKRPGNKEGTRPLREQGLSGDFFLRAAARGGNLIALDRIQPRKMTLKTTSILISALNDGFGAAVKIQSIWRGKQSRRATKSGSYAAAVAKVRAVKLLCCCCW